MLIYLQTIETEEVFSRSILMRESLECLQEKVSTNIIKLILTNVMKDW